MADFPGYPANTTRADATVAATNHAADHDLLGGAVNWLDTRQGLPLGLTGATGATRYVGATTSGSPTTGTFTVGDFVVDRGNGHIRVCTVAGTPGTWVDSGATGPAVVVPTVKGDIVTYSSGFATQVNKPVGADGTTPVANTADDQGWTWTDARIPTVRTVTSNAYTLVSADIWAIVEVSATATSATVTVPPDSALPAVPVGALVELVVAGAFPFTVQAGAGVTLRALATPVVSDGQWTSIFLRRRAANDWQISNGSSGATAATNYDLPTKMAGLRHWRAALSNARPPVDGNVANVVILGDSITEGSGASKRNLRWVDQFAAMLARTRGSISRYVPAAGGTFNGLGTPGDWVGGQPAVRYSGVAAVQQLTRSGSPTSGTFTANINNSGYSLAFQAVTGIPFNASLVDFQARVDATPLNGYVTVGGSVGAWTLTFNFGGQNMALTTITANTMAPSGSIAVTATATGSNSGIGIGPAGHGARVSNGYVEFDYWGDLCSVNYSKDPTSPGTGAPVNTTPLNVTIDGVTAGTINAYAATQTQNQTTSFGTVGDFGFHTLRVTVPSGTNFLSEGFVSFDNISFPLGQAQGGVAVLEATRGGYSAQQFATDATFDSPYQSTGTFNVDLFIVALGTNDIGGGRTTGQFKADMTTLMTRLSGRTARDAGFLLIAQWTWPATYVAALREVAATLYPSRTTVVDLHDAFSAVDAATGGALAADGTHPTDTGHTAIAQYLFDLLEPSPVRQSHISHSPAPVLTIDAARAPESRKNWPENLSWSTPGEVDTSPNSTTVAERRYRVWFSAHSTYEFRWLKEQGPGFGDSRLFYDGTQIGTYVEHYGATAGVLSTVAFGSVTVPVEGAGWHYVTVKTTGGHNGFSSGYSVPFRQLTIRKTSATP